MSKYEFKGWSDETEKKLFTEPWEKFQVCLYRNQTGDVVLNEQTIAKILEASGYKLVLQEVSTSKKHRKLK